MANSRYSLVQWLSTVVLPGNLGSIELSHVYLLVLLVFLPVFVSKVRQYTKYTTIRGAPVAGRNWKFEPLVMTRYRFVTSGWPIVRDGWEKVRSHQDTRSILYTLCLS